MHVLETERLLFRDHEDADMEPYCEMESGPEYRAPQRVHPRAEVERSDDGEVIPGEARLAYYLARPYWGRGLATEAGRAFVLRGFDELGLARIEAGMNAANLASVRVVEKLGFVWVRSGQGGGNRWHEYELRNPSRAAVG